jgi:hypothetical protein
VCVAYAKDLDWTEDRRPRIMGNESGRTAYFDRCLKLEEDGLAEEYFTRGEAEVLDLVFEEVDESSRAITSHCE